jgi:hypothetical protein
MPIHADEAADIANAHGLGLPDAQALATLADDVHHAHRLASMFCTDDCRRAHTEDPTRKTLAALTALTAQGITTGEWLEASGLARATFMRHRSLLVARGLVTNVGTDRVPRYTPSPQTHPPST